MKKETFDIVALGEYLIDFSPCGSGEMGNPAYEMNPGGAPVNCLTACTALGGHTAFIGCIGDDIFGEFLLSKLIESRIDVSGLMVCKTSTTLVFVTLDQHGERRFAFLRNPGADTQIGKNDINYSLIDRCSIFHFGSLSLSTEPAYGTTLAAIRYAKRANKRISYDPNYREFLWKSRKKARQALTSVLPYVDSIKLSEEEMALMLDVPAEKPDVGAKILLDYGISNVYITQGGAGTFYATSSESGHVPGFTVPVVDTTGCGDAFTGAILFFELNHPHLPLCHRVRVANAVGALCATKKGGMTAMPVFAELISFLSQYGISNVLY